MDVAHDSRLAWSLALGETFIQELNDHLQKSQPVASAPLLQPLLQRLLAADPVGASAAAEDAAAVAALRQLVGLPEFAAFVEAADGRVPELPAALTDRCRQLFSTASLLLVTSFCEGCLAAFNPGGSSDTASTPPYLRIARAISLAAAGLAVFCLGWIGYQLLLRPAEQAIQLEEVRPGTAPPASRSDDPAGLRRRGGLPQPAALPPPAPGSGCTPGALPEQLALAAPSNFGERLARNWQGEAVAHQPNLIVLHETVVDEAKALQLFQSPHNDDAAQASYHVLIGRDGRQIRVVPDDKRAFGAGDSAFGQQAVQLKEGIEPSVNNFALHVSLVSPADGADGEARSHSGYTPEQYRSLAARLNLWRQLYRIPLAHIVTHQDVDRSGTRRDPRSLDWQVLNQALQSGEVACAPGPIQARSR